MGNKIYDFILKLLIYTDMFQKFISRLWLKKIFFLTPELIFDINYCIMAKNPNTMFRKM